MSVRRKALPLMSAGVGLILLVAAGCSSDPPEPARETTAAPEDADASATGTTTSTPAISPTPETRETPQDADASVTGTVAYRERIALTPGATLTVQLRDTSLMDVASELIAEQVIPDPGQVPISFRLRYRRGDIEERNTYSVSARIEESDDRLAFINDTSYNVITRGSPSRVDMVLVLVEPPPEMVDGEWSAERRQPVEAPVTVTGAHMIFEGEQAFVRVVFVVSDVDGCYRRGREEATVDGRDIRVEVTAWVPPPEPWAVDCSEEDLELDAIAHLGSPLTTGDTYNVTINGEPGLTFTAP